MCNRIFAKQMIPAFESAAPPEVWVGFAAVVRTAANGLSGYGVPAFACFVLALMFFVSVVLPNATGAWRYRAERARGLEKFLWVCAFPLLPVQTILGLYRDIQGAQMLTNLAGFLVSGRGLQDAVQELSRSTTPWMRRHLFWILQHLQTFQESAHHKMLPIKHLRGLRIRKSEQLVKLPLASHRVSSMVQNSTHSLV